MKHSIYVCVLFAFWCLVQADKPADYYNLLNIPRDATVQEIRKAFKNLALKMHPDKNKEDPEAEQKFIKIAKAYDVLKDPTTRKQYDLYGDEEFKNQKNKYHSYTYYRDHFGIYDDDPLITTLSKNDYEINVLDQSQVWFVNFYSPRCHHCHEMAPMWRKLATELEGIVRIAAVNCEEDYALCYQLSIDAYPSLLYYEKDSHLYDGEKYRGPKTLEALKNYVLSKVNVHIEEIDPDKWNQLKNKEWVIFFCSTVHAECPDKGTIKEVAASLEGLLPVGIIRNIRLCEDILKNDKWYSTYSVVFWQIIDGTSKSHLIEYGDSKQILNQILNILPHPPSLDENQFQDLRTKLRLGTEKPWLICFYLGTARELDLELKRLPSIIPTINIGLIHCGKSSALCSALHITRYPTWAVVKDGGAFEIHQGRDVLHEIAAFARDSTKSTNLHALSPSNFDHIKDAGTPWYIDWYAPWCPPCKKLTPELRRASQHFEPDTVQFGMIDCTLHNSFCSKQGINSYPSMILYNNSVTRRFSGPPNEAEIVAFIQDVIKPVVVNIDDDSFGQLANKPVDELWIVNYFAPWCRACHLMELEYRNFAKSVTEFKEIIVAKVNCETYWEICNNQHITGYPTVRLYPMGSKGLSSVAIYNGERKAPAFKQWALSFIPSKVETLDEHKFIRAVIDETNLPLLVDFYAPWCVFCVHFEPQFRTVAQHLDGKVKSGKIDCESNRLFCGHQGVTAYPTVRLYLAPDKYFTLDQQDTKSIINQVTELLGSRENAHDEL